MGDEAWLLLGGLLVVGVVAIWVVDGSFGAVDLTRSPADSYTLSKFRRQATLICNSLVDFRVVRRPQQT